MSPENKANQTTNPFAKIFDLVPKMKDPVVSTPVVGREESSAPRVPTSTFEEESGSYERFSNGAYGRNRIFPIW